MPKWIRELHSHATGNLTGMPFASKAYAMFLRYACGFTNPTQNVGGTHWTYEKTGTAGEFNLTGVDTDFRDAVAASFVAGDIGKWVLIVGDDRNTGWYEITGFTGVTTITVNFRAGAGECPTVQVGLTWYLMADNYQTPANDNWWRLRTPNVAGWELEGYYVGNPSYTYLIFRISINADWTATGKITNYVNFVNISNQVLTADWFYLQAWDGYGQLTFMNHAIWDGPVDLSHQIVIISDVTPVTNMSLEPEELVAISGTDGGVCKTYYGHREGFAHAGGTWDGHGADYVELWDIRSGTRRDARMLEYSYSSADLGFTLWNARTAPVRRGIAPNREDIMYGSIVIMDALYIFNSRYHIVGNFGGHYSVRSNIGHRTTFYDDGVLGLPDKFHWDGGFAIDWPGITPQH